MAKIFVEILEALEIVETVQIASEACSYRTPQIS
jgi:hypothetical protein